MPPATTVAVLSPDSSKTLDVLLEFVLLTVGCTQKFPSWTHTSAKEAQERGGAIIHQLKHFREQGNLKRAALMASNGNSPAYLLCFCLLTENTDGAPLSLRPNTEESEHPINVVLSGVCSKRTSPTLC